MTTSGFVRFPAAWAAGTAVLLLAGCAGGSGAGSEDRAAALPRKDVGAVLPGREAMPGWKMSVMPSAVPMNSAREEQACVEGEGCEGSRFHNVSSFTREDGTATVGFSLVAYRNGKAAAAAYDVLWKQHERAAGAKSSKLDLKAGDRSDARLGVAGFRNELGAVVQMRVGTTLAWVELRGEAEGAFDDGLVRELAEMLSERAREAEGGDTPTAGLRG